ncbi:MAG: hypothetical protein WC464_04610 [Bdellovibrionales bacterium]
MAINNVEPDSIQNALQAIWDLVSSETTRSRLNKASICLGILATVETALCGAYYESFCVGLSVVGLACLQKSAFHSQCTPS